MGNFKMSDPLSANLANDVLTKTQTPMQNAIRSIPALTCACNIRFCEIVFIATKRTAALPWRVRMISSPASARRTNSVS